MGIIVAKDLRDDVVEVRRKGDRILLIKLVLGDDIFNVIRGIASNNSGTI